MRVYALSDCMLQIQYEVYALSDCMLQGQHELYALSDCMLHDQYEVYALSVCMLVDEVVGQVDIGGHLMTVPCLSSASNRIPVGHCVKQH